MKALSYILLVVTFVLSMVIKESHAQKLDYAKVADSPEQTINHMLNIAPVEGFVSTSKYTASSLMLGINGVYGFNDKLGFEGYAGIPYFTTKGIKGVSYVQGGAFFNISTKEKMKETKVILNYKRTLDVISSTETYTYLAVPAKVKHVLGLRAGIQHNSSSLRTDGIKIAQAEADFKLTGIYAGIQSTSSHLIKTQLKGEPQAVPTGSIYKLFADVMVYPVSKIDNAFLSDQISSGNLGARAGVVWVQNPYAKKHQTDAYNPFLGRMNMALEIGSRPIDGFYFKGGVYWGIIYR